MPARTRVYCLLRSQKQRRSVSIIKVKDNAEGGGNIIGSVNGASFTSATVAPNVGRHSRSKACRYRNQSNRPLAMLLHAWPVCELLCHCSCLTSANGCEAELLKRDAATTIRRQTSAARVPATCSIAPATEGFSSCSLSAAAAPLPTAHLASCPPCRISNDAHDALASRKLRTLNISNPLNLNDRCQGQQQLSQQQQLSSSLIQALQCSKVQSSNATLLVGRDDNKGERRKHTLKEVQKSIAPLIAFGFLVFILLLSPQPFQCKSVENSESLQLGNEINKSQQTKSEASVVKTTTIAAGEQFLSSSTQINTSKNPPVSTKLVDFVLATTAPSASLTSEEATTLEPRALITDKERESNAEDEDESTTTENDADDAEGCEGLSADGPAAAKNLTDSERLVNLQTCFQRTVRHSILSAARSGMDMFYKLSLTGGCSSSLMNLMSNFIRIKSFAFKFVDASAKLSSGMMLGLLSDYGDFDECLSIRSNPLVEPENEIEERSYSGKYCMLSVKLKYHIKLAPNETVPKGIDEDGIFWDELVHRYWTSNSTKGFQLGMCFPSRCTTDDLEQIYKQVAMDNNIDGEIISCQDSLDLKRQYQPDLIQRMIIYLFCTLIFITIVGTLIDRYHPEWAATPCTIYQESPGDSCGSSDKHDEHACANIVAIFCRILVCFSLIKNWKNFISKDKQSESSQQWDCFTSEINRPISLPASPTSATTTELSREHSFGIKNSPDTCQQTTENVNLSSKVTSPKNQKDTTSVEMATNDDKLYQLMGNMQPPPPVSIASQSLYMKKANQQEAAISLSHLSGIRLIVIFWITIGHSFLYPSAHNYQYYRSIISIKPTRDSVWFVITNFTLGIDMILYMSGLVFVYKVANLNSKSYHDDLGQSRPTIARFKVSGGGILRVISKKILRLWPTYLTVIALAIAVPMLNDGPLWPEMVIKRLGESCRKNWWSNTLFINNYYLSESEVCLPSSWFISVLMQLFIVGSTIVALVRLISLEFALTILTMLLFGSCATSFTYAYLMNVRAPIIRLDESFVMELDESIFRLYTNTFSNLGPFLIGMLGGLLLVGTQMKHESTQDHKSISFSSPSITSRLNWITKCSFRILVALIVMIIGISVLSSAFHQDYSRFWASIYWSLHRVGWAIVTGYIVHNCATGRWNLLKDLLSLSSFIPLSKLIFIAYLVNPIFIHVHSGLVRDGLHVSIYNMLNIYTARLVMTFATALFIHLLVELPFNSIEEIYFDSWFRGFNISRTAKTQESYKFHPLLAAVVPAVGNYSSDSKANGSSQEISSMDSETKKQSDRSEGTKQPTD